MFNANVATKYGEIIFHPNNHMCRACGIIRENDHPSVYRVVEHLLSHGKNRPQIGGHSDVIYLHSRLHVWWRSFYDKFVQILVLSFNYDMNFVNELLDKYNHADNGAFIMMSVRNGKAFMEEYESIIRKYDYRCLFCDMTYENGLPAFETTICHLKKCSGLSAERLHSNCDKVLSADTWQTRQSHYALPPVNLSGM